ncbi:CDC27 family protein [Bacillus sp. Cr_A10]|uniref:tetratricopeptide repeat protein n=1 Tax=Bacillus sp. Cr_A10 TaxID=3033993 RepID=UPI0023DB00F2|nr:CDC27 family protein [Bacillus sp. Cr_A10]MDF2068159.1 tetratricopeptide repeat protein [Bacillus sp. Cr_A10]
MKQRKLLVKTKKSYTNYILVIFILVTCIVLFYVDNKGSKQDEQLLNGNILYHETDVLLQEGNYENAITLLEELHTKYNDDYNITFRLGYSYLSMEQYTSALTMYTRALDLNPYLVENKEFMYQYAITLANCEQVDNALTVVDRLLTLPMDETFEATVLELKDSISNMKGTTT